MQLFDTWSCRHPESTAKCQFHRLRTVFQQPAKQQADAASDALLQEPRSAQEKLAALTAARASNFAPGRWTAPAALLGGALAGGIGYFGFGNFHPWWMVGVGLGIGLAQGFWRRRHKV